MNKQCSRMLDHSLVVKSRLFYQRFYSPILQKNIYNPEHVITVGYYCVQNSLRKNINSVNNSQKIY